MKLHAALAIVILASTPVLAQTNPSPGAVVRRLTIGEAVALALEHSNIISGSSINESIRPFTMWASRKHDHSGHHS